MCVDATCKYAAVGCQDRCIRIFNISSGKQKKIYKGSLSEDGSLLRVQIDPSGQYVATSCSDKNISIFDFYTGECVATMFGHSEIVTGMKFTNDCKHLITVSGDSCIFVWRLAPELTISMRERLFQLQQNPNAPPCRSSSLRREVYSAPALGGLSSDSDHEQEEEDRVENDNDPEDNTTSTSSSSDSSHGDDDTGGSDEGQDWEPTKPGAACQVVPEPSKRPRRRWSHRMGSLELMVKSMLDLRQLDTFAHKKSPSCPSHDRERLNTSNVQEPTQQQQQQQLEERSRRHRAWPPADWMSSNTSKGMEEADGAAPYAEENEDDASPPGSDYTVKEQRCRIQGRGIRSESQDSRSPDSARSLGYGSRESSPDHILDDSADVESLSPDSSDEEHPEKEEEEEDEEERRTSGLTSMEEALRTVSDGVYHSQEDFLRQNFETLAESCSTAELSSVPRLSMSSRFLARGHNNSTKSLFAKVNEKEQNSLSAKPPVSKVRPLMEAGESRNADDKNPVSPGRTESPKAPERDCSPTVRPLKKKTSGSHLWRLSNPVSRSLLLDRTSGLQKSHSAQNLSTDSPRSPVPSADRRELRRRPQQLLMDQGPSFHLSSPSSGSPQSPQSPLPWDSPKLKPQHSYMNPTASSMAKSSRSSSLGDGIQMGTPPSSPSLSKACRLPEEPPLLTSSPSTAFPPSVSSAASLLSSVSPSPSPPPPHPTATISPLAQSIPPSRIPLPKQPLGPRRSLCLEVKPSLSEGATRASTPTADPGCEVTPTAGLKQARGRNLSLTLDLPSFLPVKQKRDSITESVVAPGQVAAAKERPLVPDQPQTSSLQPDHSVTLETCRQAITELHSSLRRTVDLYTTVLESSQQPSEDQEQMMSILSEALFTVKSELDSVPQPAPQRDGPEDQNQEAKGDGDKTLALLEQYAELLLRSVERKLDTKS